jgi:hypothetical protein
MMMSGYACGCVDAAIVEKIGGSFTLHSMIAGSRYNPFLLGTISLERTANCAKTPIQSDFPPAQSVIYRGLGDS